MNNTVTQQKIYIWLRNFCIWFGFFSIGASIYLWLLSDNYVNIYLLKLHAEHLAIFFGLWCPTLFSIASNLNYFIDKGK